MLRNSAVPGSLTPRHKGTVSLSIYLSSISFSRALNRWFPLIPCSVPGVHSVQWSDLRQMEALEQGLVRVGDAVELAPDGTLGARPRARVVALVLRVRVDHDSGTVLASRREAHVAHRVWSLAVADELLLLVVQHRLVVVQSSRGLEPTQQLVCRHLSHVRLVQHCELRRHEAGSNPRARAHEGQRVGHKGAPDSIPAAPKVLEHLLAR
eukprot:scaffold111624_cov33-Phaeocystis_antarctica.AAC.1